ncbi:MAG: aldo/keto reductase [Thermoanaerobaculia bacterium]|nr:aldo/keto reductase [Thermoanaerobaculia bacterium]
MRALSGSPGHRLRRPLPDPLAHGSSAPVGDCGSPERAPGRGKIGAWGVCNFTRSWLEELLELGRPATNQIEIHPFLVQDQLYDACREWGIPLTAYSPLARGRVTGDRVLKEIGETHGKTAAQVALRWSLDRGRIVIPKSSGSEHLRENLDVFDFSLDDDELDRIDALDAGERIIDPSWMDFDR